MKLHQAIDTLLCGILAVAAFQFHYLWIARYGGDFIAHSAYGTWMRPFVFRALLPFLSRVLEHLTPIPAPNWLVVLFVTSSVGLYFSVKYLYETFQSDTQYSSLVCFLICIAMFGLIFHHGQYYDLATAMFFALAFALLVRGQKILYLLLFPIATLNRETTFLLAFAFAILSFQKYRLKIPRYVFYSLIYQVIIWALIRAATITKFADNPGALMLWRPMENLRTYASMPVQAFFFFSGFLLLIYAAFVRWHEKPVLLRLIFLAIFPVQFLLHMTMGYPWEVRVYAESFPILCLLVVPVLFFRSIRTHRLAPEDSASMTTRRMSRRKTPG